MVALEMEETAILAPVEAQPYQRNRSVSKGNFGETCPFIPFGATSFDNTKCNIGNIGKQDEDLGIDHAGGSRRSRGHPNVICVHAVAWSCRPAVICVVNFCVDVTIVEAKRRHSYFFLHIAFIGRGQ